MSDTRLVPVTKEQRDTMSRWNRQLADNLVAAFDAAPADPAEAVRLVLDGPPPTPECTCGHKPEFCHKVNVRRWCLGGIPQSFAAPAVLRALGYPDPDASEPHA